MSPAYTPGQLLLVWGVYKELLVGDVVMFKHHGKEKIKRIKHVDPLKGLFLVGDNPQSSTDSRTFGWIDYSEVVGKIVWPRR